MFAYVWRHIFQRKVRSGLSMLGVSVSVAGIVALISVAQGMRTSLDDYMEGSGASLIVFSGNVADLIFSRVKQAEIDAIAGMDDVDAVARVNFLMVRPPKLGKDKPTIPTLFCFGRYPEERTMQRFQRFLREGRVIEKPDEILVSRFISDRLGWSIGDELPLFGGTSTIVGLYQSSIPWENGGLIVHAEVLAKQLGRTDNYTLIFVYTASEKIDAVQARIKAAYPGFQVIPPDEFTMAFDEQLALIDEFIYIITLIALVVGVLGVLNTMMMSVAERTREIGMLRALGWSRGRVLRTIMIEGVLLSVIGGGIGLLLGVGGTEALIAWYDDAYLVARYLPETFAYGALVALVVGVLAALYPAMRAANLRPVEALRYE
ncbi:MAG: ABC transporter permease [Planctomycetota bacterium]|jgi:putative ABC transport system permease protein